MKKWNEDKQGCCSCILSDDRETCLLFRRESNYKCYSNRQETEHLLKLWDDANGSIEE